MDRSWLHAYLRLSSASTRWLSMAAAHGKLRAMLCDARKLLVKSCTADHTTSELATSLGALGLSVCLGRMALWAFCKAAQWHMNFVLTTLGCDDQRLIAPKAKASRRTRNSGAPPPGPPVGRNRRHLAKLAPKTWGVRKLLSESALPVFSHGTVWQAHQQAACRTTRTGGNNRAGIHLQCVGCIVS